MKKRFNNFIMKIMIKTLPLIKYPPFKWFGPLINKVVNWYMQKRFPVPKQTAQPADQAQATPPADQPKS